MGCFKIASGSTWRRQDGPYFAQYYPEGTGGQTSFEHNTTWQRYESAFKLLWGLCVHRKMTFAQMTLEQMAGNILYLNKFSVAQARNAYSALLTLPGWEQLRFCHLLQSCKRKWNTTQPKYSTFWDATTLLKKTGQHAVKLELYTRSKRQTHFSLQITTTAQEHWLGQNMALP